MTVGPQLCILIFLLIIGACVHKPDTFSMNVVHNEEDIYFEQSVFSKGSYKYRMGHPDWKDHHDTFKFSFELDDISSLYYAYLSIETWDVEIHQPIFLNDKKIGRIEHSTSFSPRRGTKHIPSKLEATQIYLPKRFFRQGRNALEIKAKVSKRSTDDFAIGRLDIVVIKVKHGSKSDKVESTDKTVKRYFPKQLRFFSKLTDEELYISMVQLPSLLIELNLRSGIYKKKLSYIYSKIGDYYRWNGDYTKNLLYQKKATESETKESLTPLRPYLKTKLGLAYYYVGDYRLALAECRKARKSLEKIDTKKYSKISQAITENLESVRAHINAYMALNYYHLEKYELAEEYAKKAAEAHWLVGAPMANSLGTQILGHIALHKKNYRKSTSYYQETILHLYEQPEVYNDLIAIAKLYRANAQFLEGKYKEAADGIYEVEGPTHEFKWRSHLLMGNIVLAENRLDEAVSQFSQSIEEIEFSRAKLNSHGFKVNFMNDKQVPYQKIIGTYEKLGDSKKAFYYAEKAKARAFLDLIAASKDFAYKKNAKLSKLSAEEKKLRETLIDLQNRLDNEKKMFKERGVNEETKIKLENARSALQNFYRTTATENEYFASLSTVDTLTMKDVIKLIPEGVSLVEYYYDPNHVYIWVLDNKQHHFIKKDILSSELENLTKEYRNLVFEGKDIRSITITKTNEQRLTDSKIRFRQVNDVLGSILLDGVFDQIKTHKVYIVPHGVLHYLPFQTLTYRSHYLIERYQIGYIPSATALKYVFAKRKQKPVNLLAFGNPELSASQMQLPFAEQEVQDLKNIYPGARILIGEDASEANFKQQAGAYDIVHVASHGEFNSNTPLLSCLRLSAGNGEDGRLETREIFGLNLDAYLVTLSACNTAIGKLTKGDDVIGLTRAFIFAGTPSILGTIWSVNDESTSIFMNQFYKNLKEMDKLKSLQQAQIAMIQSGKYSHPYHWAGFQLIGDYY
jgi:CHAT domain-containing protein